LIIKKLKVLVSF